MKDDGTKSKRIFSRSSETRALGAHKHLQLACGIESFSHLPQLFVRLADPLIDGSDQLTSLVEDGEFFVYLFRGSHLFHEMLELGF